MFSARKITSPVGGGGAVSGVAVISVIYIRS
jgi:hypothetical protein